MYRTEHTVERRPPPPQGSLQRFPDPTAELGTIVAKGIYRLATKHYIVSSMWVAGLITLTFFQGFVPSPENLQQYNQISKSIDHASYGRLAQDVWIAEENFRASKGWFTCDHVCQSNKRAFHNAQAKLNKLEKQQEKQHRQANSHLGVFSTFAVDECKQLFWKSFKWGKKFGTRQTLFDMLFVGVRSMGRNESMIEYTFSILLHFLVNMTLGMLSALVGFTFSLWGFIRSYSPDLLTGLFFFGGAVVSAAAMVATYVALLYGTAGATLALGTKALLSQVNRIEQGGGGGGGPRGQPRRNLHYE